MTWPSDFRFISFLYNTFTCINIPWRTHCIHTVWTTNEDAGEKSLEESFVEFP